jgi:hypothetical protein
MVSVFQLVSAISNYKEVIIANIANKSLKMYDFIKKEFLAGDITSNDSFQSKYSSFYRLNGAGLTKEFKSNYFKLLQEKRNIKVFSKEEIKDILLDLYKFKSAKGYHCIHFSFTTKLIHTIENNFPIYDSKIKKFFGFKGPHPYHNNNEKIDIYLKQHGIIHSVYNKIIEESLLKETFNIFSQKFSNYYLNKIKILDFMFWTAGKLNIR